jgi:hypothetical protein
LRRFLRALTDRLTRGIGYLRPSRRSTIFLFSGATA